MPCIEAVIMRRYDAGRHPITKKTIHKPGNPERLQVDLDQSSLIRYGVGIGKGKALLYFPDTETAESATSIRVSDTLVRMDAMVVLRIESDDPLFYSKASEYGIDPETDTSAYGYYPDTAEKNDKV